MLPTNIIYNNKYKYLYYNKYLLIIVMMFFKNSFIPRAII
jgi:hypothetical protein